MRAAGVGRLVVRALAATGLVAAAISAVTVPDLAARQAGSDIIITLRNNFIEQYKGRATIETNQFSVDSAGNIHAQKDDGEVHVAGRSPDVELPIVAEVTNARSFLGVVGALRSAEGQQPIRVAGAWRIWCEHAGSGVQKQGQTLSPFTTSNPAHVFEIHPLTRVGDASLLESFAPIEGYKYKEANTAFLHYENVKCRIRPNADGTTTLFTSAAGYNFVEFILESNEDQAGGFEAPDGRFLKCQVRDLDGELIVREVRMVFVKDTAPERAARTLAKGRRLHVVGLPRIDLALVKYRVEHKDDEREPLNWNLPYEIIVVAAFPNTDD